MNTNNDLINSLTTSYLDKNNISAEGYHTKLLVNDHSRGVKVLRTIQHELDNCEEFLFSVAFITEGGLTVLANQLKEASDRGVKGKILTSSYLLFNSPKMFRKLLRYPNLEVKIYEEQPLHAKGYIFRNSKETTFIVGSSNLTTSALCTNKEWNLKLTSLNQGKIIDQSVGEFNYYWDIAQDLTEEWIQNYESKYIEIERIKQSSTINKVEKHIIPNTMQTNALKNLERLRSEGNNKALLISSTGTGKTYLSAFDVKNVKPRRMLFVIHREQIAKDALESFKRIMPDVSMGIYSGNVQELQADYIFTTVQTMSKKANLEKFDKSHFDYMIIDEAHRTSANTYQNILDYFTPDFLLGMTATPERTDGNNIFEHFDYNIAYEIRLQTAMEEEMLCPFHYFGVKDFTVDGKIIDDTTSFNNLIIEDRIDHIIDNINYYGYSGDRVKGLIFCSRNEEALAISNLMNEKGFKTVALSGKDSQEDREKYITLLTGSERALDYIITVDIFNEGIDIPELNQIVMLRPTQSSIIFVQQMGRGLRKNKDKSYVNIIDFIGNYKNNFLIPIALSGDTSFDKDKVKQFMIEGNSTLPGTSTINFDKVSREKIFEAINTTNFSTFANVKIQYFNLKYRLGRIPNLLDFMTNASIDPELIFNLNARSTYHEFLKKVDSDYTENLEEWEEHLLLLVSKEMCSGKRDTELLVLKELLDHGYCDKSSLHGKILIDGDFESAIRMLDLSFFTLVSRSKYGNEPFIRVDQDVVYLKENRIPSDTLRFMLYDLIEMGLFKFETSYKNRDEVTGLVLNERYSRQDMCKYFNWDSDNSSTVYGYLVKHNTFPIFVTYHKQESISDTTNYKDQFINNSIFSWDSKNRRTLESKEIKSLQEFKENNLPITLFVKREDAENKGFFYLGKLEPIDFSQGTIGESKQSVVHVTFKLKDPVREDIYHFLTES